MNYRTKKSSNVVSQTLCIVAAIFLPVVVGCAASATDKSAIAAISDIPATQSVTPPPPDIGWYTKNPDATHFEISTAAELAGLAALVNGTAGIEVELTLETLDSDARARKFINGGTCIVDVTTNECVTVAFVIEAVVAKYVEDCKNRCPIEGCRADDGCADETEHEDDCEAKALEAAVALNVFLNDACVLTNAECTTRECFNAVTDCLSAKYRQHTIEHSIAVGFNKLGCVDRNDEDARTDEVRQVRFVCGDTCIVDRITDKCVSVAFLLEVFAPTRDSWGYSYDKDDDLAEALAVLTNGPCVSSNAECVAYECFEAVQNCLNDKYVEGNVNWHENRWGGGFWFAQSPLENSFLWRFESVKNDLGRNIEEELARRRRCRDCWGWDGTNYDRISFKDKIITLTQDIDLSEYSFNPTFNEGRGWDVISNCSIYEGEGDSGCFYSENGFAGTFDGNGKTISGLYSEGHHDYPAHWWGYYHGGLFGFVTGTIKNLGVVDARVIGSGGIVGRLAGGGDVSNIYFTGNVENINSHHHVRGVVGGIVGELDNGSISNCYFAGTITYRNRMSIPTEAAGGIAGRVENGAVSNCYSVGSISGGFGVGGIVGLLDRGAVVSNSYSIATISGVSSVGGIVGYMQNLNFTEEYRRIDRSISRINSARRIWAPLSIDAIRHDITVALDTLESVLTDGSNFARLRNRLLNVQERLVSTRELFNPLRPVPDSIQHILDSLSERLENTVIFDTLSGRVSNCVALNSTVSSAGQHVHIPLIDSREWGVSINSRAADSSFSRGGRVVGGNDGGRLSNNVAFTGISDIFGETEWGDRNDTNTNGADITVDYILLDGTLGGRFTSANGWTTQNGRLPGLFGQTVELPEHLR